MPRFSDIPFIEIRKPRSYQPLDTALKNLSDYDWLILTSVNGVEALWQRVRTAPSQPKAPGPSEDCRHRPCHQKRH